MAKYELTNKAVEDLTGIWEYTIEKWSEQQADRYYKLLLDSCQDIANNHASERFSIDFLGIQESVNNQNFNYGEFATIRSKAGLNLEERASLDSKKEVKSV